MVIKHAGHLSNPGYTALDMLLDNCNEDSSDDVPSLNDADNWSDIDATDLSETETESDTGSYYESESSCDDEESYSTEVHISIVESDGSDEETSADETAADAEEDSFLPTNTSAESPSNASVPTIDEVQEHCPSASESEENDVDLLNSISEEENTASEASLSSQAEPSTIDSAVQLEITKLRHAHCDIAKVEGLSASNLDNTAPTKRE
jgi:hypothetical protein